MPSDSDAIPAGTSTSSPNGTHWLRDCLLLTLLAGLWFCAFLGMRPLANPDEGRYSEIPREMAASGDFVTPRLNGVKYFEKPPLLYWLSALTFKTFGLSEFTARFWGGCFALFGVLLTYATARTIYGRQAGIWSAIVLSTSILYYVLGQIILLDTAVAVTISGALFCFLLAMRQPRGRKRFALFMAFYVFMALATLTKGLIGIALPGAVVFLWVLLLNRWKALWPFYPLAGTLLLLAIAAPWHVLAARANPDFLHFYFIHEHWERFTTRVHGRYQPWWFFLALLPAGVFPWTLFAYHAVRDALAGGWKARHHHAEAWFFAIWIGFVVAFFSKSQSKLVPYILPVFPAVAVMVGPFLAKQWQERRGTGWRTPAWIFIALAAGLAVAACVARPPTDHPELLPTLPVLRTVIVLAMAGGIWSCLSGLRRGNPRRVLAAIAGSCAVAMLSVNLAGNAYDSASTKPLSMILKPILKPEDRIYNVRFYAQDMPFYLNLDLKKLVNVVLYRGELQFGVEAEPEASATRFIDVPTFYKQWTQPGTAYAVMHKWDYELCFSKEQLPHTVLGATNRYCLVVNQANWPKP